MNILIICALGVSSGILKRKLNEELTKRGIQGSVEAVSVDILEEKMVGKDIILVAPQLRIQFDEIKEVLTGKLPYYLIEPTDYGMMNVSGILDKIQPLVKK